MSNKGQVFLFGSLILIIGVLAGLLWAQWDSQMNRVAPPQAIQITELVTSQDPFFSQEKLETLSDRFLFQQVAERIKPSVVFIEAELELPMRYSQRDEDGDWGGFMHPHVTTMGSGVIISTDGYILTNNHVIDQVDPGSISITLMDKRSLPAAIAGRDPSTDLALLKIEAQNLQPAVIGNSDRVQVGDWVLAVGNPFRLRSTVTAGIVSALSRQVEIIDDALRIESFIQTDAAINRGNSGGALVNTSGELIGINTAIATQSGNYQGYGFAVPSNLALKVGRDLMEFGETRRGTLGVSIVSMSQQMAEELGLTAINGVRIVGLIAEGAAVKAGLKLDDIILQVNGQTVEESNQLQERIALHRPGERVRLRLWREGREFDQEVDLGQPNSLSRSRSWFSRSGSAILEPDQPDVPDVSKPDSPEESDSSRQDSID